MRHQNSVFYDLLKHVPWASFDRLVVQYGADERIRPRPIGVKRAGSMIHDLHVLEVKKPSDSKQPWDYLKLIRTVPGDQAFRPLSESECPLVKTKSAAK